MSSYCSTFTIFKTEIDELASKKQAMGLAKNIVTAGDEANRHPTEIMPALWALTVYKGVRGFSFVPLDADSFEIYMHGSKKRLPPKDGDYDVKASVIGSNADVARTLSEEIPSKWKKMYQCKQYSADLKDRLKRAGIKGELLEVRTGTGFIQSDQFGNIATTGIHQAIKVDDMIFDNLRPNGIKYSDWIDDLGGKLFTNPPHAKITHEPF